MNRGPVLAGGGILVGLALAALVSTCGGPDAARSVAPEASLGEQCGRTPENASRLTVTTDDGSTLGGAVVSSESPDPDAAVVIVRHGGSHTLCDLLGWSADVGERTGAVLLLLDRRGQGSSAGPTDLARDPADTLAALDASGLAAGGRPLVVLGSSMGNASAFTVAGQLPQAACAVISVSPVPASGPLDGVAALGSSGDAAPASVHLVWAREDGAVPRNAATLSAAARDAGSRVETLDVGGDAHARAVLDHHATTQQFVLDAITQCSRP